MLCLTSTLSTLSRLISKVSRLMKPVLWTTRMLVTSVSVVQRWNQAVAVQYKAASPATAANAKQTNANASAAKKRHSTRNATTTVHAAIAGRKYIQCSLVEYSTLSPGCMILSIYRAIGLLHDIGERRPNNFQKNGRNRAETEMQPRKKLIELIRAILMPCGISDVNLPTFFYEPLSFLNTDQ